MRYQSLLAIFLLAFAANADEVEQGVHVDIANVIAAGKVESVDGITSSGQPDEKALKVFADSGYRAVVDMRGPDEDRGMDNFESAVAATGMQYVEFPVVGSDQVSFETAAKLDQVLRGIEGPVLVHCASGNRVGALLALRHSLNGASDEESIQYGKDAGMTRLEPRVQEVLKSK